MHSSAPQLSVIIASEDWFARAMLGSLAEETGLFAKVTTVDDGYSALAETWEEISQGGCPNVFIVDAHSVGPSFGRMVTELRADPATRHVYIAVLTPDEPVAKDGINFATPCTPAAEHMSDVIELIGARALVSLQTLRAA
jgi:CheY-like chemotaxis protein